MFMFMFLFILVSCSWVSEREEAIVNSQCMHFFLPFCERDDTGFDTSVNYLSFRDTWIWTGCSVRGAAIFCVSVKVRVHRSRSWWYIERYTRTHMCLCDGQQDNGSCFLTNHSAIAVCPYIQPSISSSRINKHQGWIIGPWRAILSVVSRWLFFFFFFFFAPKGMWTQLVTPSLELLALSSLSPSLASCPLKEQKNTFLFS
jgi:hypothetical protein